MPVAKEPIAVTATESVQLGEVVRISVTTTGTGLRVRVRQILPDEDQDVSNNLLDLEGPTEYGFTSTQPGGYVIEAQAVVGEKIETALVRTRIEGANPNPVDPNKPPPGPGPIPGPNNKPTRVTYVFEKDVKNTPRVVAAALQKINAAKSGIVASEFEEDTLDGQGEVPDQYKIALAAAREKGLPALVVQSGEVVLRVIKDPTTEAAVLEAAK